MGFFVRMSNYSTFRVIKAFQMRVTVGTEVLLIFEDKLVKLTHLGLNPHQLTRLFPLVHSPISVQRRQYGILGLHSLLGREMKVKCTKPQRFHATPFYCCLVERCWSLPPNEHLILVFYAKNTLGFKCHRCHRYMA